MQNLFVPTLRRASQTVASETVSGMTSAATTSRHDTNHTTNGQYIERLFRCLNQLEIDRLKEAFHKPPTSSYVTVASLPAFLTSVGVVINQSVATEDLVRSAIERELEYRYKDKTATTTATGSVGGHSTAAIFPNNTAGGLHRMATKIMSARRLSGRLSVRSHHAHHLLASSVSTSEENPAPKKTVIPSTLSLDIILWVCRILKDDMVQSLAHMQQSGNSGETLEAFKSCADEATGLVSLNAVQQLCNEFSVVLPILTPTEGEADYSPRVKEQHHHQQRHLTAQEFAQMLETEEDAPPHQHSNCSSPIHRPATAPLVQRSVFSAASRCVSPKKFAATPYSENEIRWFTEAEELNRSGPCNDESLANVYMNALLGDDISYVIAIDGDLKTSKSRSFRGTSRGALAAMNLIGGVGTESIQSNAVTAAKLHVPLAHGLHATIDELSPTSMTPSGKAECPLIFQQYFTPKLAARPSTAPGITINSNASMNNTIFTSEPKSTQIACSRHELHTVNAQQYLVSASGAGKEYLEAWEEHHREQTHSTLNVASQATGTQQIALGIINTHPFFRKEDGRESMNAQYGSDVKFMIEKQVALKKSHPARAAILGNYYADIDQEHANTLSTLGALHGATTATSANTSTQKQDPEVFTRLSKSFSERPAISLHRLQLQLESLENSAAMAKRKKQTPTALDRLHRFRSSSTRTRCK